MKLLQLLILLFAFSLSGFCQDSVDDYAKVEQDLKKARKEGAKKKTKTKLYEGFQFGMSDDDLDVYIRHNDLSEGRTVLQLGDVIVNISKSYFLKDDKLNGLKLLITKQEIERLNIGVYKLNEMVYQYFSSRYTKGKWFELYGSSYSYVEKNLNISIDPIDFRHMRGIVVLFFDERAERE